MRRALLFGFLIWLLASTSYLTKLLVSKTEKENKAFRVSTLDSTSKYFIFVLAAGYEYDRKLPAIGQLNLVSLGRINEAVRITKHLKKFIIVTSGCTFYNTVSQAMVAKNAAIELGVDSESVEILETPANTLEEAQAFLERFGRVSNLILVTDALHMPRALRIFNSLKMFPIAAPTNYNVKFGVNSYNGFTLPKLKSLKLMRCWFLEMLKTLIFKYSY